MERLTDELAGTASRPLTRFSTSYAHYALTAVHPFQRW